MKILMLSPVPTHPPIADNRARILMLVDSLIAADHTLNFVWVRLEESGHVAMMDHFFRRFTEHTRHYSKFFRVVAARRFERKSHG
ncbi:MAG: hypothetical protein V4446_05985 [Pseudomonadota bacterium]